MMSTVQILHCLSRPTIPPTPLNKGGGEAGGISQALLS